MEIDFIGMSLNLGANKLGVESGFDVLDKELDLVRLFGKHPSRILTNIVCPSFDTVEHTDGLMKNRDLLFSCNQKLGDAVYSSLEQGHFPIVIGGDHALAWGSISGVAKHAPEVGCIYIDAHGDFNPAEESPSHNVHGMHMSYLMGMVDSPEVDFYEKGVKLSTRNVFFVGTRSLDPAEVRLAKDYQLNIQTSDEIRTRGIEVVTDELIAKMEETGLQRFHISFDIDSIDPLLAPGTGVPECNGITVENVKYLLTQLFATKKIISLDFVEFNPLLDVDEKTLKICKDLLEVIDLNIK